MLRIDHHFRALACFEILASRFEPVRKRVAHRDELCVRVRVQGLPGRTRSTTAASHERDVEFLAIIRSAENGGRLSKKDSTSRGGRGFTEKGATGESVFDGVFHVGVL